jgi:type 1 glutamine amidotransferase
MKRALKWAIGLIVGLFLAPMLFAVIAIGPANFGRLVLGIGRNYDHQPPVLPKTLSGTSILIFSKTNGYRDDPQIKAANAAIEAIARKRGWTSYTTENAAIFNPEQLKRFKVAVWNSVSGDVLSPEQREAFKGWLEAGGGFVALHGSGGDLDYAWKWYVNDLIGAQFIGHTMGPQFQRATLIVEDRQHPATRHLPERWSRTDEWYSFASSPRAKGYHILATLDEGSYRPKMKFLPFTKARDLQMGKDHPMIWTHCLGKGRAFYSALGHPASAYTEPEHLRMIDGAIAWAAGLEGPSCGKSIAASVR